MLYLAYIDESDTHGHQPDMSMTAMLGSTAQWERYSRRLRGIQKDYGFTIFHGTDFKGMKGDFAGWSGEKYRGLLYDMGKLVADNLTECISINLAHADYRYFLEKRPAKMHQSSQYGICFSAMLDALLFNVTKSGAKQKLSVIMEAGHPNATDAQRIFEERRREWADGGHDVLRDFELRKKDESHRLMAADMASYGHSQEVRHTRSTGTSPVTEKREPKRGEVGWTNAEVGTNYVDSLIADHNAKKEAAHQRFLERRAAWQARGELA